MGNNPKHGALVARQRARAAAFAPGASAPTGKTGPRASAARAARIERMEALRDRLDQRYGDYRLGTGREHLQDLYRQYPELRSAVNSHLAGSSHLSAETVARANRNSDLSEKARLTRAEQALAKLSELSQWSLLHAPGVTPEGTIRLYHGGSAPQSTWERRLSSGGGLRSGTSFTDRAGEAERWAGEAMYGKGGKGGRGTMVQADVPIERVMGWHGLYGDFGGNEQAAEHEYTLSAGTLDHVQVRGL